MNNLSDAIGWCKSLAGIPNFGVSNIQDYFQKINSLFSKSSVVKKHFQSCTQLIEENYIDIGSIYSKQNDDFFCIKGICAAGLKKENRWAVAVIDKKNSGVIFAHCEYKAGKTGTCSHSFAILKLLAKWVLDKIKGIPEPKPCTSRPCVWSVPQSRDRVEKPTATELKITTPASAKKSVNNQIFVTLPRITQHEKRYKMYTV